MITPINPIQPAIITNQPDVARQMRSLYLAHLCMQAWQRMAMLGVQVGQWLLRRRAGVLIAAFAFFIGCTPITPPAASAVTPAPAMTQVSTLSALQLGLYDGDVTFAQLAQVGDFGLGTFDGLDGEMIALDGTFYQARVDGSVQAVAPSTETPFANVHFFQSEQTIAVNQRLANFRELQAYLAQQLPSQNQPYALKIRGAFPSVKIRSVAEQREPYPPLQAVIEQQTVFDLPNINGTLVGYFMPDYLAGVASVGYHFHFLSDDRQHGGHLLDVGLTSAILEVDRLEQVVLLIPQTSLFQTADFTPEQQ
jgi:acetolactate decarboxylase